MSTEQRPLNIFLCHAESDQNIVRDLYRRLTDDGVEVWISSENLLPGLERDPEIRKAVQESDAVVVCLSEQFNQPGPHQRVARIALDAALEQPDGEIFIIPARLEACAIPESLGRFQWVDLFQDQGYEKLIRALQQDAENRNAAPRNKRGGKKKVPASDHVESKETSQLPLPLLTGLQNLRSLLKRKNAGILIVAGLLLFGCLIYALVSRSSMFSAPSTVTPTSTLTATSIATNTALPTSTNTLTPTITPTLTPTLTLVPATDTPTPTLTAVPPAALGADWIAGCISTLWHPYPPSVTVTERGDGCWNEPVHVFSAENGDLDFLAQRRNGSVETNGLFALLPERGTVTVRIRLRELSNADLWMGVFAEQDVRSEGLLMIIPSGEVRERVFVQKEVSNYETISSTSRLPQGNGYSISFTFSANSVRSTVNPSVFFTTSVPVPSSQKWLFLGYKGLSGSYRVDGTFLSFELK
jgi:hypothetical protein